MKVINNFTGIHDFLDSRYPVSIMNKEYNYTSLFSALFSLLVEDKSERELIASSTDEREVLSIARASKKIVDSKELFFSVMDLCFQKYSNPHLYSLLNSTVSGDEELRYDSIPSIYFGYVEGVQSYNMVGVITKLIATHGLNRGRITEEILKIMEK